jgi:hypothetical protein
MLNDGTELGQGRRNAKDTVLDDILSSSCVA